LEVAPAQYDQCDGRGEQYLREPDIKHAESGVGLRRDLGFSFARLGAGGRAGGIEVRVLLELLHFFFRLAVTHGLLEAFDGRAEIGSDGAEALVPNITKAIAKMTNSIFESNMSLLRSGVNR